MTNITVFPGKLSGTVVVPPSKSAAHRAILCAALGCGTSEIQNVAYSQDILATIGAVRAIGATVTEKTDSLTVTGISPLQTLSGQEIFCNESGSTLRFVIPIALACGGVFSVAGAGRLMQRPLDDYFQICDEKNIRYQKESGKISFCGKLTGGKYSLSGNVSSQYITGLLLALPLLSEDSIISITTPVESVGYLDLTVQIMKEFGVHVDVNDDYRTYRIPGNQTYRPREFSVEGDYSQAAFFLVANALGSNITVSGLSADSCQGDKAITDIIELLKRPEEERVIDVSQVPDLVPILSVLAAKVSGVTKLIGASRLRLKESDRLHAVAEELAKLGAKIKELDDSLEIQGNTVFVGGTVDSHNDHRMAMSLAIAATAATGPVEINGADSVNKSYADFWERIKELGGEIN